MEMAGTGVYIRKKIIILSELEILSYSWCVMPVQRSRHEAIHLL
jgi:hypothetical protein